MNELMGHRLKGAGIKMPEPVAQVPFVRPSERARQLVQNLKQVANVTGGKDPVARHLARARSAELQQDLVGALNSLRMAMAIAADRPEVISEHDRVKLMLAKNMAGKYEEQARYEESKEKWGAAAISWAKVFEGRPEDGDAALKAADYLIRANGDLHTARTLAQTAVRLKPSATAHRVLGEVFLAANLRLNAKREFETALKLDPKDEIVKNHLSRLRDVEKT